MAFTLIQAGNSLKTVNATGALSSALTIPSGITLSSNRIPRFARFKGYVCVVNTPSRPLIVAEDGRVSPMTPNKPGTAVALADGGSGTLSGTYLALQTFIIKDALGNVIAESDYSPAMDTAVTVTTSPLAATYDASAETDVTLIGTRLYRTVTLGATYFPWIDDMTNGTTVTSDLSDASLSSVAAGDRGAAPDLTLIAEFGGRLWGVDRDDVDDLRYTEAGTSYAWSALNTLKIPHYGQDAAGITALIPRRNVLGVARRDVLVGVTGSVRANIRPDTVPGGEKVGVISQESVVVFNDIAYFLSRDGVYTWDSSGVRCITNGKVRGWFTEGTTFNKAMYWRAFAQFDQEHLKYRLFLASTDSDVVDRWIEYDIPTDSWWGPHLTTAFSPTSSVIVAGSDQQEHAMIGTAEGFLSQQQDARNDWGIAPIAFRIQSNKLDLNMPEDEKFFGEMSIMGQVQDAGTLTVTPSVGEMDEMTATTAMSYDMTKSRQRLGRIGVGKAMQLVMENSTIDQDVVLRGYTIDPVTLIGRR